MKMLDGALEGLSRLYIAVPPLLMMALLLTLFFFTSLGEARLQEASDRLQRAAGREQATLEFETALLATRSGARGVLLTGDSIYPGRIYVSDFPEYQRSIQRLVDFTRGKIVTHLLGTHIEEANTPYLDYPVRTVYQADEHPLALSRGVLLELNEALINMHDKPTRFAMRDITIWPREPPARRPNPAQ